MLNKNNNRLDRVAVILNYMNYSDTIRIVKRLIFYQSVTHVVIVDNASPNESFKILKDSFSDDVHVIKTSKNNGYASGNNYGSKYAISKWGQDIVIFIINPDIVIEDATLNVVANYIEQHKNCKIGQVAPKLSNNKNEGAWKFTTVNKTLLFDGIFSPLLLKIKNNYLSYPKESQHSTRFVDVLLGAFFAIYGKTFMEVNFFDEATFLYTEEQILALRLKAKGYSNLQLLDVRYSHVGGTSTSSSQYLNGFKEVSKSRRYLIKEYLGANQFQLVIFDFSFMVSYTLRKFFSNMNSNFHRKNR
ncbi:glycosyltransferase [Leuconostoc mesenteroides]|uniref:glycosyltransferase n=1 Tax=Leuconostoc mesenteroides TaxID=1245 RepID=UPI000B8DB06F|nr:glycosyltransferase family 2 protein [Leuconostoc mesenteroides]ASR69475.1 hypothetical protein CBW60_08910 [Leuconostoc mesenteroides]QHM55586.1 Rhamnosyltransferase WbbL [Leuconostoc mesenteroides]